jgi:hydrogenase nickel incorporation protein HypA/HybF
MHELSIAQSIIDIALNEMHKANATSVSELELEVGMLAGIEYSSLDFALECLMKNKVFESTRLVVHKPEGKALCTVCRAEFAAEGFGAACPACGGYQYTIVQGKELRVKTMVVE